MTINEQDAFNKEINAICHRYNIRCLAALYISYPGKNEQNGVSFAFEMSDDKYLELAPKVTPDLFAILDALE